MPLWALPYAIESTSTWQTLGGIAGTWTLKIPQIITNEALVGKFIWCLRYGTMADFQQTMSVSNMRAFDIFHDTTGHTETLFDVSIRQNL